MSAIPDKVTSLAKAIRDEGGRALLVGGCVRDELIGRQPKDWDVEVYAIEPRRLRELLDQFGEVNLVGEAFTVYKLGRHLDISLPRRERKTGAGHRAFLIEGEPAMTVAEAASRRDFTINAILQDPLTQEVIDPFHGRDDLNAKILRANHARGGGFSDGGIQGSQPNRVGRSRRNWLRNIDGTRITDGYILEGLYAGRSQERRIVGNRTNGQRCGIVIERDAACCGRKHLCRKRTGNLVDERIRYFVLHVHIIHCAGSFKKTCL